MKTFLLKHDQNLWGMLASVVGTFPASSALILTFVLSCCCPFVPNATYLNAASRVNTANILFSLVYFLQVI